MGVGCGRVLDNNNQEGGVAMARGITDEEKRKKIVDRQVKDLCRNFGTYLDKFNDAPPFKDPKKMLSSHTKTMCMRKKLGGVANNIIDSDEYLCALRSTLVAWGMDNRKAELKEYDKFAESIRGFKFLIVSLEPVGLAQIDDADITRILFRAYKSMLEQVGLSQIDEADTTRMLLWLVVQGMGLSQTYSQTITGAKALHHLLPQLMPPIDGQYTGKFFHYSSNSQIQTTKAFSLMLSYFSQIAQNDDVDLGQHVRPEKWEWATSETKVIDNAIIGYCVKHPEMLKGVRDEYDRIFKNGVAV